jgi:hypothetical protein
MLDIPTPNIDLQKLVSEMTDDDLKALTIQNFRMLQELIGFTRQVSDVIDKLGDSPMLRAMGSGLVPPGRPPRR